MDTAPSSRAATLQRVHRIVERRHLYGESGDDAIPWLSRNGSALVAKEIHCSVIVHLHVEQETEMLVVIQRGP